MKADVKLSTPIEGIRRRPHEVEVCTRHGEVHRFDQVFIACHSDQALDMLSDPTPAEREVLSAFPYAANEAILHTDASILPKRPWRAPLGTTMRSRIRSNRSRSPTT